MVPLQMGPPGGLELLVILFVMGVPLLVTLVATYLVYRSAARRDSRHALAWALGAFFGGLVVWILYYVVRDEVGPGGAS
ncbi:MAG: hypothetical protein ABEJ70_04740 [Halobacteriaceae archaeon]